jgi:hypothetical protein
MSPQFQLVMHAGPTPGKVFTLSESEVVIGRDITNQIIINDAEVSRRHCRFVLQGETYMLEDLGSTNGTFVDGQRITSPRMLQTGQTIRLGENVTLYYEGAGYDPAATAVAGAGERGVPSTEVAMPRPAQQQQYPPPSPQPVPPRQAAPGYSGQVPPGPPADQGGFLSKYKGLLIGCAVVLLLGVCVVIAGLWYIDANYLWCDIFGSIIPGCP